MNNPKQYQIGSVDRGLYILSNIEISEAVHGTRGDLLEITISVLG